MAHLSEAHHAPILETMRSIETSASRSAAAWA
jgi:hypothetical protein